MLLLYIEILKEPSFNFQKPTLEFIKSNFSDLDTLDLDNHSENYLFDYALKAFQENDQGILFFDIQDSSAQLGKSILLLNKLIKKKEQMLIFLKGNHSMLEKMLKIYPNTFINLSEEKIKEQISSL
ncbi:MAG: hypothetical protein GY827_02340 [Cytophagales bacterium]|nr:hypothetical protein [Cytophagales bacterium]